MFYYSMMYLIKLILFNKQISIFVCEVKIFENFFLLLFCLLFIKFHEFQIIYNLCKKVNCYNRKRNFSVMLLLPDNKKKKIFTLFFYVSFDWLYYSGFSHKNININVYFFSCNDLCQRVFLLNELANASFLPRKRC